MFKSYIVQKKPTILILLLAFLLALPKYAQAQKNISGKSGLFFIPDAYPTQVGNWTIGYMYNPIERSLRGRNKYAEQILYTTLDFTKRLQFTFLLLQQRKDGKLKPKDGIGDRQMDFKYQILFEKSKQPALALIMSSPFTVDAALQTTVLVASKTFKYKKLNFKTTVGIGSPYYIYRDESNLNNDNAFSKFKVKNKAEDLYKNNYLVGPFAGIDMNFENKYGLLLEWDGDKINTGIHTRILKRFHGQVGLLAGKYLTGGFYFEKSLY